MKNILHGYSVRKAALLGLLGTLAVALATGTAIAQEKNQAQNKRPVRAGYTRPGMPNDEEKDGKVIPVAWKEGFKGKLLGGTVYFAVFERTGTEGDLWGTGMANFDETFIEGRSFNSTFSPTLDTKAKYLYLYMVVNDRGLDPTVGGVKLAVVKDFNTEDIASSTVKLHVDPRYITSWGHFRNSAFGSRVAERDLSGDVVMAADGKDAKYIRMALSSNPAVLAELPFHQYLVRSPAYPLGDLRDSFGVAPSGLGLKAAKSYTQLDAKRTNKEVLVKWQETLLKSDVGREPNFVQLLVPPTARTTVPGIAQAQGLGLQGEADALETLAYFRADWQGDNTLKLANHSVVFGFTTDLPPMDTELRIDDIDAAKKGAAIRAVADGGVIGAAAEGSAPGTGPTPAPPAAVAESFGGGSGGVLGGQIGGGGMPATAAVGSIGAARPAVMGGGGAIGSTGGGSGSTGSKSGTDTGSNSGTTNTGQNNQTLTASFNATLTNAQSQNQSQKQRQNQSQSQRNGGGGHGHVVPGPGAFLLGLFGLPALLLLRRRKAEVETPAV